MKKVLTLALLLTLLTGCNPQNKAKEEVLNIISVNDLHGAIMENEYSKGMASLKYQIDLIENQDDVDNTIVIGNGDMLQGTALSNVSKGESVIEVMNDVGFDILGIGNHEFDWGIEEYLKFFDGDKSNGESTATLVNSNLYYKDSGKLLEHSLPYTVIDLDFIKVGVVSFAPGSLTSSILQSRISNIDFRDVATICSELMEEVKSKCDIVIANTHSGDSVNDMTNMILNNYGVSAIINGHRHSEYNGYYDVINQLVPVVQNKDSLKNTFGYVQLTLKDKKVTKATVKNVPLDSAKQDAVIKQKIDEQYNKYAPLINEELCYSSSNYSSKSGFPKWGTRVILDVTKSDVSIINTGAFRNINISKDKPITNGDVFEIMPFDNEVILFELTGEEIHGLNFSDMEITLTDEFDDNIYNLNFYKTYQVAIIDYLAYKSSTLRDLISSGKATAYPVIFRDLLVDELREHGKQNIKFDVYDRTILTAK